MEESPEILDLSNKKLKKLYKPSPGETLVETLILDDNDLQRLDNIDCFLKLQKLSAVRNQLLRMYGVCRLQSLRTLNLANNGILTIEGLKELTNLQWLCLAGNSIKTIEHLNTNVNLEHLDLSENSISHISDLSFLKNLKELYLHKNRINHLNQCDKFLPVSLTCLTLAYNNITDLNEISRLVNLTNLTKISINNNPCVNMTGSNVGFDYRPFIINWCLNVNVIDDYVVDAIESLRAEWLYSQGRGRNFRIGDHQELVQYLATVCPLTGEALETEEDRKLRLILSKAQHHQQQLREQHETPIPSPITRKKIAMNRNSPRLNSSRLSNKIKSPDRMSTSCYSSTTDCDYSVMSHSLDSSMLKQNLNKSNIDSINDRPLEPDLINSPLQALSKMVPVPESLMSPDYHPTPLHKIPLNNPADVKYMYKSSHNPRSPNLNRTAPGRLKTPVGERKSQSPSPARSKKTNKNSGKKVSILRRAASSEDESEMFDSKLQNIQMKVEERKIQRDFPVEDKVEMAAVRIQKMWRGYHTRNKNKEVQEMFRALQNQRAQQHIQKLSCDMENTKMALESERKIQMLQTEAISALWKKISALQAGQSSSNSNVELSGNNVEIITGLAQTCNMLQNQIVQLQSSMQDIVKVMSAFSQTAGIANPKDKVIATQTEIVAVHTPQGEAAKVFPFQKQSRPSSLPLPVSQKKKETSLNSELRQYAGNLVDGVIRTVSETKADCLGHATTEITVTNTDHNNDPNESHENEALGK